MIEKSPDDLGSLYKLAFIENKIAETFFQLGKRSDPLNQPHDALATARKVAAMPAASIEQQAYYLSTPAKIGNILIMQNPDAGLDEALADFAEAISLRNSLLAKAPGNNIILGNLSESSVERRCAAEEGAVKARRFSTGIRSIRRRYQHGAGTPR